MSNKNPIDDTTARFLSSLWQGGAWAYFWYLDEVETYEDRDGVAREKKRSVWFPVGKGPSFTNAGQTEHTFFGIHPTGEQRKTYQRSDVRSITAVNCLFCEFDGDKSYEEVLAIEPKPSYIAESSPGKYHAYWLTDEPYRITNDTERKYIQKIQYAWVDYCGGDDASKDLARVLRVPGTRNVKEKYAPNYPVVTWRYTGGEAYPLDVLHSACAVILVAQAAGEKPPTTGGGLLTGNGDVIGTFNKRYNITQCLAQYGYTQRGQRWVRPGGSRALVVVEGNRSFHHSGDDAMSDGFWHKPFDLYCHYEHNNDVRAAVKAAAQALGLGSSTKTPRPAAAARNDDGDNQAAARGDGDDQAAHTESDAAQAATEPKYGKFETRLAIALKENGVLANEFARNSLTQKLEYSGQPITDDDLARYQLIAKDAGIRDRAGVLDALAVWAARNAYNPIQQYLEGLPQWDGTDHIAQLAAYFHYENPDFQYDDDTSEGYFALILRKWLIGAVQRAYTPCQNPMLVLVGAQGIGKSYLARWLGSDMPAYHTESAIQPDNKDNQILATQKWVWEVAELGATTRRTDVEALKAFLTKAHSDVRLPYARTAIQQPMLASYIGSLNQGDYLTDETGNRRFWNVSITAIDRAYSRDMLPSQVWAQAYALWQAGETNALLAGEAAWVEAQGRERYSKETGYESYISRFFTLASDGEGMDGNQIAEHINDQIKYQVVFPKDIASGNLKRALIACGYTQTHKRVGGRLGRFWNCAPGDGCNNRYTPVTTLVTPIQRITKPNIQGCYNVTTQSQTLILGSEGGHNDEQHTQIKVSEATLLHPEATAFQGTTKPHEGVTTLVTPPCNTPGMASRQEMLAFLRKHTDLPEELYPTYTNEELAGFVEMVLHPDDDADDGEPASEAQGDGATGASRQEMLAFLRANTDLPEELYPTYSDEELAGFVEWVLHPDDDDDDEPDDDDDGPASDAAPTVPEKPTPNGDAPASEAAPNGNGNDEQRWWGGKPIISDKRLALLGRLPAHISGLGKTDEELEQLIAQSEGEVNNEKGEKAE